MESASSLPPLPFRKKLREGQRRVLNAIPGRRRLNVNLPTGYGKTFTHCAVYATLQAAGLTNRHLVIFPTDKQLDQFVKDGPADLFDACVDGPRSVVDLRFFGTEAIKKHRRNEAQVFVITIQSLIKQKGMDLVKDLLETGRWMITVDEYHHYGAAKTWGKAVLALPCQFLLTLSATPYRPTNDGAFGPPDVTVSYRDAQEERAVKTLVGHSYIYVVEAVLENGDIKPYTTSELVAEVGEESPDAIEKHLIQKKMRWSPRYVSPLVSVPIERMLCERLNTGYRLQALVGALCVSHATMVCEQLRDMFPDLRIDWVGTGCNGRTDEENARILNLFCPPKDDRGERNPELDVLVHVGMAGEGLDPTTVSEIIHLNPASVNNSNLQENGRAARWLDGVTGHINFDSSSGFAQAGYVGKAIMDAMDCNPPSDADASEDEQDEPGPMRDVPLLPDEPLIRIWNMELDSIDSGSPEVIRYERWLINQGITRYTEADIRDPASPLHDLAIEGFRNMRRREAEAHNAEAITRQWQENVREALSAVAREALRIIERDTGKPPDKKVRGEIYHRINARKKFRLGPVRPDIEVCRTHYQWLVGLQRQLRTEQRLPEWLR